MTIKQYGGIFGRNPTFNNATVDGTLTVDQIVEKTGASGITLDGVTLKDGNVVLTNGKGIDFSATAGTGTSELFDDYEEGTWTPVISDAATGGNLGASPFAAGQYTKIGNVVVIDCRIIDINTAGMTAGNTLFIQGLPYASRNTSFTLTPMPCTVSSVTSTTGNVFGAVGQNATSITMREGTTTGGNVLTVAAVTSGSGDIRVSGSYMTA